MVRRHENHDEEFDLASFGDRVAALSIDLLAFFVLFAASMKLVWPEHAIRMNPNGSAWYGLWVALFLAYQAVFSSGGRTTLGRRVLGIQVVDEEGRPLGLGNALVRSASYLASTVLNLGFLWVLVDGRRRAWHDLIAGTLVVETRPKSLAAMNLVRLGATASLGLVAATWLWTFVYADTFYSYKLATRSHMILNELAGLQEVHLAKRGRYSESLLHLAKLSPDPMGLMADVDEAFADPGLEIRASDFSYSIRGVARDWDQTPVVVASP